MSRAATLGAALLVLAAAVAFVIYRQAASDAGQPPSTAAAAPTLASRVVQRIPVRLADPRGIAANGQGEILVCGDRELQILDAAGAVRATFAFAEPPRCVAAGPGSLVYLGFDRHLAVLDTAGGSLTPWTDLDRSAIVTSVAVSSGLVYAADAGTGAVFVFDPSGRLARRIGGFLIPSPAFDVVPADGGGVWAADTGRHRLVRFDGEGRRTAAWGSASRGPEGFSGCCNPAAAAALPDGSLVTFEKGHVRLKVHGADGALRGVLSGPPVFRGPEQAVDLTTAADGAILALLPRAREIVVLRLSRGGA